MGKKIIVTGAAGFIGAHTCDALCKKGYTVIGADSFNTYYDANLKRRRLEALCTPHKNFSLHTIDISKPADVKNLFYVHRPDLVLNLAGQVGVRNSVANPEQYVQDNVVGLTNILSNSKQFGVNHVVYASSSSVYGNPVIEHHPLSEGNVTDQPESAYAATKKCAELMAHAFASMYGMPVTGLRFFTVYGPWGRPDMATFKFTKAILNDEPIDVFNNGNHKRDFTYIDDIVEGVICVIEQEPKHLAQVYNIGNGNPVELPVFIKTLEDVLGKEAIKNDVPKQAGDVLNTWADMTKFKETFNFEPKVDLQEGLEKFVTWYRGCKYV